MLGALFRIVANNREMITLVLPSDGVERYVERGKRGLVQFIKAIDDAVDFGWNFQFFQPTV